MKVTTFYRILLLVFFLGFGRATMATTGFTQEMGIVSDYGADTDSHRNYGDIPTNTHVLFHERNSELPSNSQLKSHPGLLNLNKDKGLYSLTRKSFLLINSDEHITVGLDSLTIIYPFHTFL